MVKLHWAAWVSNVFTGRSSGNKFYGRSGARRADSKIFTGTVVKFLRRKAGRAVKIPWGKRQSFSGSHNLFDQKNERTNPTPGSPRRF